MLGHQAEAAIAAAVSGLTGVLERLEADGWRTPTAIGNAPVVRVTAHLAQGADRIGRAWEQRLDLGDDDALLHTFDSPTQPPATVDEVGSPEQVLAGYREATDRLIQALASCREDDWSWPVWSPLGGVETLAEAARRFLAHHHVHRCDIHDALSKPTPDDDEQVALVSEFVLDAMARRGGDAVTAPMEFDVTTAYPGAGTWTLVFDQPRDRSDVGSVWSELIGSHPAAQEGHRVERGASGRARLRVNAPGDLLWRAAFGRGGRWSEVELHGDDDAKAAWHALVTEVHRVTRSNIGAVVH